MLEAALKRIEQPCLGFQVQRFTMRQASKLQGKGRLVELDSSLSLAGRGDYPIRYQPYLRRYCRV